MEASSAVFNRGDAINLTVKKSAYPWELEYDYDGNLTGNLMLRARVLRADDTGIMVETVWAGFSPQYPGEGENEYFELSAVDRGYFFPWSSVSVARLVLTNDEYESEWAHYEARQDLYAEAHNGEYANTRAEMSEWAKSAYESTEDWSRAVGKRAERNNIMVVAQ